MGIHLPLLFFYGKKSIMSVSIMAAAIARSFISGKEAEKTQEDSEMPPEEIIGGGLEARYAAKQDTTEALKAVVQDIPEAVEVTAQETFEAIYAAGQCNLEPADGVGESLAQQREDISNPESFQQKQMIFIRTRLSKAKAPLKIPYQKTKNLRQMKGRIVMLSHGSRFLTESPQNMSSRPGSRKYLKSLFSLRIRGRRLPMHCSFQGGFCSGMLQLSTKKPERRVE